MPLQRRKTAISSTDMSPPKASSGQHPIRGKDPPAGETISVFSQNLSGKGIIPVGEKVRLTWAPSHGFVLDGGQDINAGVEGMSSKRMRADHGDCTGDRRHDRGRGS